MPKENEIIDGNVDYIPDDYDPKKVKVRISLMVDSDLLQAYKDAAKKTSHGEYQTLMKENLREAIDRPNIEGRMDSIEAIVRETQKKMLALAISVTKKNKRIPVTGTISRSARKLVGSSKKAGLSKMRSSIHHKPVPKKS